VSFQAVEDPHNQNFVQVRTQEPSMNQRLDGRVYMSVNVCETFIKLDFFGSLRHKRLVGGPAPCRPISWISEVRAWDGKKE